MSWMNAPALRFSVRGQPVGKARPRFSRTRVYTPANTVYYERQIGEAAKAAMFGFPPVAPDVAFDVEIEAYYAVPASWSKKRRLSALQGVDRPMTKPDLDNLAKAVLDGMNGIVFEDDKQVVGLSVTKHYSDTPRVEVVVRVAHPKEVAHG